MSVLTVFALANDGHVRSHHATYSSAVAGANEVATVDSTQLIVGQDRDEIPNYLIYQAGVDFDYTADTDLLIASAYIQLQNGATSGTGVPRDIGIRAYSFGTTIDTGDFRTPSQINALDIKTALLGVHQAASAALMRAGLEDNLQSYLASSGNYRYWLYSNRNRSQIAPSGAEFNQIYATELSGTSADPQLIYTTLPRSTVARVGGAQVQLSDGTHAYLESNGAVSAAMTLKHRNAAGSVTTVHTLTLWGTEAGAGLQSLALVADSSDNLYILGRADATANTLTVRGFTKGGGHTWTAQTARTTAMPSYAEGVSGAYINNIAAAWHNTGTGGTILAIVAHQAARNAGTDCAYVLLNCNHILTGAGSLVRSSDSVEPLFFSVTSNGFNNWVNDTGTMLDVVAAPGSATRGYLVCTERSHLLSQGRPMRIVRYDLASGGASISAMANTLTYIWPTKDGSAKARLIAVGSTQSVFVGTENNPSFGLTVVHYQNSVGSTPVVLAVASLHSFGLDTLPSASDMAVSAAWDTVHDPISNKVWVYYFDVADGRRLMRTAVDLNTGLATGEEVEVDAAVGAAGSTNHAIRVHRGALQDRQVLVSVANETSGGVHSTQYVVDGLNVPPVQPLITPKTNFDATASALFEWEFQDPDTSDTQSAYQLQINTSLGASAYDSGKVASATEEHTLTAATLTNPGDWQWRVKTWDFEDQEGPYSDFGSFATSASGTVTIVDPASDNPAGVETADYLIEWEVAGTTQAEYRVVVVRTDTSAELLDTDWVTSTDVTYLVDGMLTDVEYEIQVTVRDGSEVETNTDTVLITPSYGTPEQPVLSIVTQGDHILVTVDNPTPTGDKPEVVTNLILRKPSTGDTYVLVGEADNNSSFADHSAQAGVTYDYIARGVTA